MPRYQPVIGLEIHVQLKTDRKMFCSCSNRTTAHTPPNTYICAVCLGHPGTLPVPNKEAVRFALLFGKAIDAEIPNYSKFDRKHYFYPDLPKGYQISQFDLPIVAKGHLDVETEDGIKRIGITRAHLEEDAAKNIHADGNSLVDFNRSGTPLLEIVTEPDFATPQEAKTFLQDLRQLVRTLGISDADMEKGHMRCDANISIRVLDDGGNAVGAMFNPKTEVKNVNSFRFVERALAYEIERQTALWKAGTPPMDQETRGWNETKGQTESQRVKEDAADYRYFPEPDIPPLDVAALIKELNISLPELPGEKITRFVDEYGFDRSDAKKLTLDPALAEFTENTVSELSAWLNAQDDITPEVISEKQAKLVKTLADWLLNRLLAHLNEQKIDIRVSKITPENFAELLTLIYLEKVTKHAATTILKEMIESGKDPSHIMEDGGLGRMDDSSQIESIINDILNNEPEKVERYKAGEDKLLKFFIGLVMKSTQGNADPKTTTEILKKKLDA